MNRLRVLPQIRLAMGGLVRVGLTSFSVAGGGSIGSGGSGSLYPCIALESDGAMLLEDGGKIVIE